jgi:hypothetical protein
MKTLTNVDDHLDSFNEELNDDQRRVLPTYRQAFKSIVGMTLNGDPEKAIDLYQLGLKFKLDEPNIQLEDAEFKLLKEATQKNPSQLLNHFWSQILLRLKDAESVKA